MEFSWECVKAYQLNLYREPEKYHKEELVMENHLKEGEVSITAGNNLIVVTYKAYV